MTTVAGVLVVKNQANTVGMALESAAHALDELHLIDNMSADRTRDVMEATVKRLDIPARIHTRPGDHGRLLAELINEQTDAELALRLEGDQVYFPDRLEEVLSVAEPGMQIHVKSALIQGRLDRQNKEYPVNPPHPAIYDAEVGVVKHDGLIWPRQEAVDAKNAERVLNVNVRVRRPIFRLMRWHRSGGYAGGGLWWNRGPTDKPIPDRFRVPEVEPPYQDHFTMREYIRLLRERGKGSMEWPGDTLEEAAEAFVEWDLEANTEPYEGEYPPLLAEWIDANGYGGFEEYLPL